MPREHDRGRPGEKAASNVTNTSSQQSTADARRRWAYGLIRKAPNPPRYGSPEWLALPEGSAEKVAAVVVAAECWAVDGDDIPGRLARQVEDERHAFKQAEDADYQARAAAHRKEYRHLHLLKPPRYAGQVVRPLEDIGRAYMVERRAEQ